MSTDNNSMQHVSKYLTLEHVARLMNICPVCGRSKIGGYDSAPVVCWGECWNGANGLKYSGLDTETWLKANAKQ